MPTRTNPFAQRTSNILGGRRRRAEKVRATLDFNLMQCISGWSEEAKRGLLAN